MTQGNSSEEIRRLMASYATGSLTEAERRMLYEAALDDQDLFDQLAGEHSLKELIEAPGVRDRLVAKLAPAKTAEVPRRLETAASLGAVDGVRRRHEHARRDGDAIESEAAESARRDRATE